jgi:asparagine synthase (glutamine-hydrolysing)
MCGITGIMQFGNARVEPETLRRMCAAMAHRGPDDEGIYTDGAVGLGMRRLSIVDLATGQQPLSNEDGSVWIVFNGEIYNHAALREKLQARGHHYRTQSDTESIVHAYEEYGPGCVDNALRIALSTPTRSTALDAWSICAACSHLPSGTPAASASS